MRRRYPNRVTFGLSLRASRRRVSQSVAFLISAPFARTLGDIACKNAPPGLFCFADPTSPLVGLITQQKNSRSDLLFTLVAETGFEPRDLRVMSPTSYQAAPLRDMVPEAGVEPVREKSHGILSPGRLPIPPFRHIIRSLLFRMFLYYSINSFICQ